MQTRIVTIAGVLGSGKSSTARGVAKRLGYRHMSTGDFFREAAKNHGMTVTELNMHAEEMQIIDHEVDDMTRALADQRDIVMDSRLAWHFLPNSFKVFLTLPLEIAAGRIMESRSNNDASRHVEIATDEHHVMLDDVRKRLESERKRYRELYGIENHMDPAHFDMVIDTGQYGLEEVIDQVVSAYEIWQAQQK